MTDNFKAYIDEHKFVKHTPNGEKDSGSDSGSVGDKYKSLDNYKTWCEANGLDHRSAAQQRDFYQNRKKK